MKLEYPMNEALPSTHHARDRLLAKIFRFRKNNQIASGTNDADFALLYAYGETRIFFYSVEEND
jgi:hypothetical protein